MDLSAFVILIAFGIILYFMGFKFPKGVGLVFTLIGGTIFVLIGISMGSGNVITTTTWFDPTTSATQVIDFGITGSNMLIIFVLLGVTLPLLRAFL